jgi:hypothetical protein
MGAPTVGPLKEELRGRRRFVADEVKEAVHDCLRTQPRNFYFDAFKKLVDRWAKCIEKQEGYVEKLYICNVRKINTDMWRKKCENFLKIPRIVSFYKIQTTSAPAGTRYEDGRTFSPHCYNYCSRILSNRILQSTIMSHVVCYALTVQACIITSHCRAMSLSHLIIITLTTVIVPLQEWNLFTT